MPDDGEDKTSDAYIATCMHADYIYILIIHACASFAFQLIFATQVFFVFETKLVNYSVLNQSINKKL